MNTTYKFIVVKFWIRDDINLLCEFDSYFIGVAFFCDPFSKNSSIISALMISLNELKQDFVLKTFLTDGKNKHVQLRSTTLQGKVFLITLRGSINVRKLALRE